MIEWATGRAVQSRPFRRWIQANSHHDRHRNVLREWEYPWCSMAADLIAGMAVLDVGSGYSGFHLSLARTFGSTIALTLVDPAYEAETILGDALVGVPGGLPALPFADVSFDRIFCISTLEHLDPETIALAGPEFHRLLRPGGRLILTVDHFFDLKSWHRARASSNPPSWLVIEDNIRPRDLVESSGLSPVDGAQPLSDRPPADVLRTAHEGNGLVSTSWGLALQRDVCPQDAVHWKFVFSPPALRRHEERGKPRWTLHGGASPAAEKNRAALAGPLPERLACGTWQVADLAQALDLDVSATCALVSDLLRTGVALPSLRYSARAALNEDISARYAHSTEVYAR